ncbi:MAG: hypothetical protein ABI592_00720 [Acidobacteriota bacterium]
MAIVEQISDWRARKAAAADEPLGALPFALEEPCPGCGAERISTMVWRRMAPGSERVAFPRIAPHYLCRDGRVVFQEITDSPRPVSSWRGIYGRFRA